MGWIFENAVIRSVLGRDRANTFFAFRFLVRIIPLGVLLCIADGYVCYWVYQEITLEMSYQHKYGADWQSEFERYHGSLSHAHTQVAVCVVGMLALVAVVGWICSQIFHKHKQRRHTYVA